MALGRGEGLDPGMVDLALVILPDQFAAAFRGVLSFWSAGELSDAALRAKARQGAATLLLRFTRTGDHAELLQILRQEAG